MNQISILDDSSLELVNAGEMSTKSQLIIIGTCAISPLLGACIAIGYFVNS